MSSVFGYDKGREGGYCLPARADGFLGKTLSSKILRRSSLAEQSPTFIENSSPCGSMAPCFGLNLTERSILIKPGDRRNGMFNEPMMYL